MKYSKAILGKDLYDLNYEDIELFFSSEKEENLNLEFKSYAPFGTHKDKENIIKKSVCSLLNSEGGLIIWGAPIETRDSNGNTKASGELTPFNVGLDRDKLINILTSAIIPMPIGIKVQFLEHPGNGSFVVIIEVEKSIERPHQYDNKYLIRLDGQTRIAPHYLIKALIQGKDFPVLRGHIKMKKLEISGNNINLTFSVVLYNTSKFNNEINAFLTVIAGPGNIFVDTQNKGYRYDYPSISILTNGRPLLFTFMLQVQAQDLQKNIMLGLQFGGEKSPSKSSTYQFNIKSNLVPGVIIDDTIYLVEKKENQLPSEEHFNDDENINSLFNL